MIDEQMETKDVERGTLAAFQINKDTKRVETLASFNLYDNGQRVYTPAFKPSAADIGALASGGTAVKSKGLDRSYAWSANDHDFNSGANTNQELRWYWHGSGNLNGPSDSSGAKTSGYGLTFGNGNHGGQFDLGYGQWPQFRSLIDGKWSGWYKLYHTGFKPTAADVGATRADALAGEGFRNLGVLQSQVGSDYFYRWYKICEHTSSAPVDTTFDIIVSADKNYAGSVGRYYVNVSRYEGAGDPVGSFHVTVNRKYGGADMIELAVKKETNKTTVWARGKRMWGNISCQVINRSTDGGKPTWVADGTFVLSNDPILNGTVKLNCGNTYDGDTGAVNYNFNDYFNKVHDSGARVYSPVNKPTAADVGAVNKAGDTLTGTLTTKDIKVAAGSKIMLPTTDFPAGATIETLPAGDGFGANLIVSSSGNTVIGAGESAGNLKTLTTGENLYLTSDGDMRFIVQGNTWANKIQMTLASDGKLLLPNRAEIKGGATHLTFVETDNNNKTWHQEINSGNFAIVESGVGNRLVLNAGGGATISGYLVNSGIIRTTVNDAQAVVANRNGHRAMFGVSATNGEYIFGGKADADGDYKHYIRLGNNKFQYHQAGTDYDVYHTGRKPTAGDVGSYTKAEVDSRLAGKAIGHAKALGSEDLDTLKTAGVYAQNANANATAARHYPENLAGSLVITYGAGPIQTYHVYNTSRVWTRAQYSTGGWTAWARQYNTANKPTAADVGALPLSGGTVTGALTVPSIIDNTTNIGKSATTYEKLTSWAFNVGTSKMVQPGSSGIMPDAQGGYWQIIGRRDSSNGYAGIWVDYANGKNGVYIGKNEIGTNAPIWQRVYTDAFKPTAADVGLSNVPNTVHTTANTANTVAVRDGSGDINARLFRSSYADESAISGGLAFRKSTTDNYIRFCNNTGAIRSWLGVVATAGSTMTGLLKSTVAGNAIETLGGLVRSNTDRVMSLDGKSYSFVTSPLDAHLCTNAYWDGAAWKKYDNSKKSSYIVAHIEGGIKFMNSDAGQSNPNQKTTFTHDVNGNTNIGGTLGVTGIANAAALGVSNSSSSSGAGISLYSGASTGRPNYGLMFAGTATFGGHGAVIGDWATYFTMSGANNRGWIFKHVDANANVASISADGRLTLSAPNAGIGVQVTGQRQGSAVGLIRGEVQGGSYVSWRDRAAGLLVDCQHTEGSAHQVWKATHWGKYHVAGMDVHVPSGAIANAQVVMHVGNTDNTFTWSANGQFHAGDVYIRSDRRLKSNFKPIESALEKVCALKGQSYDKKTELNAKENTPTTREVGLIAQDVQKVLPEAVNESGEDKLLTISNSAVNALLVEAIKELKAEIEELKRGKGK